MMYPYEVIGTMHVLLVAVALFNGFPVEFDIKIWHVWNALQAR